MAGPSRRITTIPGRKSRPRARAPRPVPRGRTLLPRRTPGRVATALRDGTRTATPPIAATTGTTGTGGTVGRITRAEARARRVARDRARPDVSRGPGTGTGARITATR